MKIILKNILFALILTSNLSVYADEATENKGKQNFEAALADASSVRSIAPVFGQLISFPLPKGFVPVFEDTKPSFYIWEAVLTGETFEKWTQMITMTGMKNLVSNPKVNQEAIVANIASGFQKSCPTTFTAGKLESSKFLPNDVFAAVLSCGISNPQGPQHSETALIIAVKGDKNYYTIQWAERSTASPVKVAIDDEKWSKRLSQLSPVNLCPYTPGDKAPFVNCK